MLVDNENTVLKQAIKALEEETGTRLYIIELEKEAIENEKKLRLDAIVGIKGYEPLQFAAEIKRWAQQANFGAVIEQVKRLPMRGLLVADYVNPKMAERLKEEEVQFIDTAGNAYINAEPLFIFIKGNKKKYEAINKREEKRRAFTQTGLKVIYVFLCDPELVRATYREIAEKADVALGTVGWVIGDLKEMGYLIDRGDKKNRRLNNYFKLLDKWVEAYPGTLRPRQVIGEFNKDAITDVKQINLKTYDAYWGGEVAGAEYTGYLRGEIDTIYVPEVYKTELIRKLKLFKGGNDKFGVVKLYKPFWRMPKEYNGYVHPILAYADLIATGDARNIETARMIKDEHIRPIWKD
jgi:hypothetical protein